MRWNFIKFSLANIVMPIIVGVVMVNFANTANCAPNRISFNIPCFFVNFVLWSFGTAAVLDLIIYLVPKLLSTRKTSSNQERSRINVSIPVPRIPIPVRKSEHKNLFKAITKKLDRQGKVLEKAGVQVEKKISKEGVCSYRYLRNNQLVYHITLISNVDGDPLRVGFSDGYKEPRPNTYTAFGRINATLDTNLPMVSLTNLSLIESRELLLSVTFSFDELAEKICTKVSRVIEERIG